MKTEIAKLPTLLTHFQSKDLEITYMKDKKAFRITNPITDHSTILILDEKQPVKVLLDVLDILSSTEKVY